MDSTQDERTERTERTEPTGPPPSSDEGVARRTNAAQPPPVRQPVKLDWQGHDFFGCPICGRNSEDRDRIAGHIIEDHPGGEAP